MWSKSGPTEEGGSGVGIAVLRGILRARCTPLLARVVKLVDTGDLKSPGHCGRAGSSPAPGTTRISIKTYSYMFFEARGIDSEPCLILG